MTEDQSLRGPIHPVGETHGVKPVVLVLLTDEVSYTLVRGQLGYLVQDGFDVHLGLNLHNPKAVNPKVLEDGVKVHHIPMRRPPSPLADLRSLWFIIKLVRLIRPSIVNASTPKAGLLGILAALMCRVSVRVHVVRGLRSETIAGPGGRIVRFAEWVSIRAATHVLFGSFSLRAKAEEINLLQPGEGEVLLQGSDKGIDLSRYQQASLPHRSVARMRFDIRADQLVIGFIGRLTKDKGITDLLNVFEKLSPEVLLLIAGRFERGDSLPKGIRQQIEGDTRIRYVGWMEDPRIVYSCLDILLFPSYREGMPSAPLEAQACGVPVVGYAATGTVDAVIDGRTGILVPVGDVEALASSTQRLIDCPTRRIQMGEGGREWVFCNFDQDAISAALADRYREWMEKISEGQST